MKNLVILIISFFYFTQIISQKYNLDKKNDSFGLLRVKYNNFDIFITSQDFLKTKEVHKVYYPDSIVNQIRNHIGKTDTLSFQEPENNSFLFSNVIYQMILSNRISKIIDNQSLLTITKIKIKNKKYKCPWTFSLWVWKGKSISDKDGNEIFLIITQRRIVNCGNAKF